MKPSEPWICGRCGSWKSRAVLANDRTPGCHLCKEIDPLGAYYRLLTNSLSYELGKQVKQMVFGYSTMPLESPLSGKPDRAFYGMDFRVHLRPSLTERT